MKAQFPVQQLPAPGLRYLDFVGPSKSKYRKPGAGRRTNIPDVREALFDWFIDIRNTLKARLPRKMFKT